MSNAFGLSRDIPDPICREVRQRCGFGCVVCGIAVYQYEHLNPPFKDAKVHDPTKIVLLCAGCHDRVTRGLMAKETISAHALAPKCLQAGFSFGPFDIGSELPELAIGGFRGRVTGPLLIIDGDPILGVLPPEARGGPFRVNAFLTDRQGREILRIEGNEWRTPASNWDVVVEGQRITVRVKHGDIALVLRADPPNRLTVERLNLLHKGAQVRVTPDGVAAITPSGGKTLFIGDARLEQCKIGINVHGTKIGIGFEAQDFEIGSMLFNVSPLNQKQPIRKQARNELCACGSGNKYKKCCGF